MKQFVRAVDSLNSFIGRWFCLLILPLISVVIYEIVLRKIFNAPTIWGFDMTTYIYGAHYMFGMGVVLLLNRHVRIDAIFRYFPKKVQLWLSILTFFFFFLPFVGVLTYAATIYAANSWSILERSQGTWNFPLYIYKTVMPVTLLLLFIQGVANLIRDIYKLYGEDI